VALEKCIQAVERTKSVDLDPEKLTFAGLKELFPAGYQLLQSTHWYSCEAYAFANSVTIRKSTANPCAKNPATQF
jgi:hypothetical protein